MLTWIYLYTSVLNPVFLYCVYEDSNSVYNQYLFMVVLHQKYALISEVCSYCKLCLYIMTKKKLFEERLKQQVNPLEDK